MGVPLLAFIGRRTVPEERLDEAEGGLGVRIWISRVICGEHEDGRCVGGCDF